MSPVTFPQNLQLSWFFASSLGSQSIQRPFVGHGDEAINISGTAAVSLAAPPLWQRNNPFFRRW
eukprot:scaffold2737_cov156-Amphora_coffeaeformis.AAC.1